MQTTTRTLPTGDRVFYIVEGDEGAITFFTQSSFRFGPTRVIDGKVRSAGDLGTHRAADGPVDDEDLRFSADCEFNPDRAGCRYDGFHSSAMLDVLAEEGPLAVFERLNAIYARTFGQEGMLT